METVATIQTPTTPPSTSGLTLLPLGGAPPETSGVLSDAPVVSIPTIVEAPKVETKGGIRAMYEGAKKLGLSVRHLFTSEDVEAAITEPVPPTETTWKVDETEVGTGPVVARSTDGNMYARMEADGSGELVLLGYPNAFNRSDPNQRFADDTVIKVQSFDELAQMLTLLVDAADPIFDASLAKVKQQSLNTVAQRASEEAAIETPPPPTEEDVHNMTIEALAAKYGLMMFVHDDGSYNPEEMIPRLADVYEIPTATKEFRTVKDLSGNDVQELVSSTPIPIDVLMDQVMVAAREAGDLETP